MSPYGLYLSAISIKFERIVLVNEMEPKLILFFKVNSNLLSSLSTDAADPFGESSLFEENLYKDAPFIEKLL